MIDYLRHNLSISLYLVATALVATALGCGGTKPASREHVFLKGEAQRHVDRLTADDFKPGPRCLFGEPYHARALIDLGPDAAEDVMQLLKNEAPIPFSYHERLTFGPNELHDSAYRERQATIGDLGDYILQEIFGRDVGFRSRLSRRERDQKRQEWSGLIEQLRTDPDSGLDKLIEIPKHVPAEADQRS